MTGIGKVTETSSGRSMKQQTSTSKDAGVEKVDEDMQHLLAERIHMLETQLQGTEMRTRDVAKRHKKSIREVQRIVADKSLSPDEVIKQLQQKTLQALNEAWRLEKQVPDLEATVDSLHSKMQSKDAELIKCSTLRDKLQDLCRELQRQNKETQKECQGYQAAEASKRQGMIANFNESVTNITARLDEQAKTIGNQDAEKDALTTQLQSMMETITASESHALHQTKAHDLERQIWDAKMRQQEGLNKQAMDQMDLMEQKCCAMAADNTSLAENVKTYRNQFQEFQVTLQKTNQMFDTLKNDARVSSAREKDLMQQVMVMKKQYETASSMLLTATQGQNDAKASNTRLTTANTRLQSVCRALQASLKSAEAAQSSTKQAAETDDAAVSKATESDAAPLHQEPDANEPTLKQASEPDDPSLKVAAAVEEVPSEQAAAVDEAPLEKAAALDKAPSEQAAETDKSAPEEAAKNEADETGVVQETGSPEADVPAIVDAAAPSHAEAGDRNAL